MLDRVQTDERGRSIYEIRANGWALRLSAREVCQLACAIETLFRDQRQQLIEDVCNESTRDSAPRSEPHERRLRSTKAVQRN